MPRRLELIHHFLPFLRWKQSSRWSFNERSVNCLDFFKMLFWFLFKGLLILSTNRKELFLNGIFKYSLILLKWHTFLILISFTDIVLQPFFRSLLVASSFILVFSLFLDHMLLLIWGYFVYEFYLKVAGVGVFVLVDGAMIVVKIIHIGLISGWKHNRIPLAFDNRYHFVNRWLGHFAWFLL